MVDDQISSRGEPPSDKRLCGQALHICLATQCMRGVPDIRWLLRAQVSQVLRQAVHGALPLLPRIVFPAHVTGADVLAMLMRVAGANLKAVSLGSCRQLSAVDIGCILADLAARCPAVIEVNLTDCGEEAILRALAVCAQTTLGAVSPADFRALLLAQAEEEGASRCPLGQLLQRLCLPRLLIDADFAPGQYAFEKAVECAIKDARAVSDVLLLLTLTFNPGGQDDQTIIFDSNQQFGGQKRALHLVAEAGAEEWKDGGPAPLASVLTLAGADVNATDRNQQTPLHLSVAKGSEAASRVLIEHRANVNAQDENGKTALHLVLEAGVEKWKDGGPAALVSLLTLAGADVNGTDRVSVLWECV